ncbi:MAG: hypothetical protein HY200_09340 [Nitrospirae bacterium]|nr:hypothetical protein [Nitrospirota bacterium]
MKQKFINSILGLAIVAVAALGMVQTVKAVELDKGLSIDVLGFVDFLAVSGDSYKNTAATGSAPAITGDVNAGKDNGYHFTRAYITAKDKLNDDLMVRLTYDQNGGTGQRSFVKFIYGDYTFYPGQHVILGLQPTLFTGYEEAFYTFRFLDKVFTDRQGILTTSDQGVSVAGTFMDKMLDYQVGVFEGEGYSSAWDGQGFAYVGRVGFNMQGVTVSLYDLMETKRGGFAEENPTRLIAFVTYGTPVFRVAGQYLTADDNKSGVNQTASGAVRGATGTNLAQGQFNKGNGYSVWAYSRIPGIDPLRVLVRYDYMKPDTDFDNNTKGTAINGNVNPGTNTLLKLAFSYDLSKTVIVALEDNIITNKIDNVGTSATDNILGVKAQVGF